MSKYNDKMKITIKCSRCAAKSIIPLLEQMRIMGSIGSSRNIKIEDWNRSEEWGKNIFGFDGDGADKIYEIILKEDTLEALKKV